MKLRDMDLTDWLIIGHVNAAVDALIYVMLRYHTEAIIAACSAALPTIIGVYHWFTVKDSKTADAP